MEIDLELPTCEQKSEIGSNRNDVSDTECGMHAKEQRINSPIGTEYCKEVLSENAIFCQDQVKPINRNPPSEPQNGLEFESKEAAYSFYREYARSVGFGITIKASRRSKKSGKFIDIKIACSRFGSKRESGTTVNPRPCIKTDCKAGMHMKKKPDGKWIIYSFVKEHNHEICRDDFFRGRNKHPGNVACQKKVIQLALDEGDVQLMIEYFVSMQSKNPNFFYAIDLDHNRCLRSVFWVDSKGRHDYQNFHDVVFVDTYYMKSKYKIPFVPIVGVNHHFQYVLLGCALIGEETASAFVWLIRTWLKASGSIAPKVIVTDQEKFLKEAVVEVFPDTRHFFFIWHILRNIPENLGYMINQNSNFMAKFNKCIYSWFDEQFEKRWWKLINRFELRDNEWVQSLYEDRKKWVPTYMHDVFLAGMSTTVRSESIISYFDKYICMDFSFKDFIERYKVFSTDRFDMEAKADFETRQKQPALRSLSPFEKQVSMIYTGAIFRKFQLEILGMVSCHLQKEKEEGSNVTFQVDDFEERKKFIVSWNESELNVCCSCHLFEYKGFLCRHAILVIQMSGITKIPSHYILKRWTKDAKANQFAGDIISSITNRMQRFNDLCRRAIKLSEIGSLSQVTYHVAFQALEEVYKQCVNANNSVRSTSEPNMLALSGLINVEEENYGNHKRKSTKNKKSYNKRGRSEPERINSRMLDSFQKREQMNSRAHNFDNCYIPQQDTQTVDLDSRAPTHDGYYGLQQNIHGDGQLNSVSPMHDSYYGNQPTMQRVGQLHSIPSRGLHFGIQQSMQGLLQGQLSFKSPSHGCYDLQESLEDMEQPVGASQFHSTTPKQLHDKSLSG